MEEGGGGRERSQLVAGSNSQQAGENGKTLPYTMSQSGVRISTGKSMLCYSTRANNSFVYAWGFKS